ncbi:MAG: MFS transporter [Actinomycetota bacterium]
MSEKHSSLEGAEPLPHDIPPALDVAALRGPRLGAPFYRLAVGEGFSFLAGEVFFVAILGEAAFGFRASPGELAALVASWSVPFILTAAPFGIPADRWSPKWMLVIGNVMKLGAALIAFAAASLGGLLVTSALMGLAAGVLVPARGAFVPRLIPEDLLVRANGLLGVVRHIPLLIGPVLGGFIARNVGQDAPYLLIGAAALVAAAIASTLPDPRATSMEERVSITELAAGAREAWVVPELRRLLGYTLTAWFLLGLLIPLEPLFVKDVLGRGQDTLGLLWSLSGVGAVAGSFFLSKLKRGAGREENFIVLGIGGGGMGFLVYVALGTMAAAVFGSIVLGLGYAIVVAAGDALIQRVAEQPGKVSGLFALTHETGELAASGLVAVAGGVVLVQPWLIGAAVAMTTVGIAGLRMRRGALMTE